MSKSDLLPIEKAVKQSLRLYFSETPKPFFVVGVSGGMDSMSLLWAFKRLGIPALVAHLNYQKRGGASDKDAELVEQLASDWGFECRTAAIDPSEADGYNFQQWARKQRYKFFHALAEESGSDGVAVAHHQDDQLETILQKMFRGAGLASWSGMEVWNGKVFRPFLHVSRAQIEQYVKSQGIPFRTDESNLKADFARNFLRNEWLDELTHFYPGWKQNVLRISEQADTHEQALRWIVDQITDEKGIQREKFLTLDPALQRAVALVILKEKHAEVQVGRSSLLQLKELADLQTGRQLQLTPSYFLLRDRDHFFFRSNEGGPEIKSVTIKRDQLKLSPLKINNISLSENNYLSPNFKTSLYLDISKLCWPIKIRPWSDGDRFQPLGMQGHQKVSDHLTNRKVSAAYKRKAMVIESFEETICAVIFPPIKNQSLPGTISEQFKCSSETSRCLEIKAQ